MVYLFGCSVTTLYCCDGRAYNSAPPKGVNGDEQFDFFRITAEKSYMTMSRIRSSELLRMNFSTLQISCSDGVGPFKPSDGSWKALKSCEAPREMFSPSISEPSLHYDHTMKCWVIVSLQVIANSMKVCTSKWIHGPWACSFVPAVADKWKGTEFITYAAKAHPEFGSASQSNSSHLVISYVPNTIKGPSVLFGEDNFGAYVPKFVSLIRSAN